MCFRNDVLPIAMGAAPEDYKAVAPPESYIHVDDFDGPAELAAYLHKVAGNDTLYNSYFRWKGTGEFINTKFMCRMCRLMHEADHHRTRLTNIENWWRGAGVCVKPKSHAWSTWRDAPHREADLKAARNEVRHYDPL
jgi:glycoprotein 3-alpha-L-fucosyltransferase